MEIPQWASIIIALAGGLGLKELWVIIKKKLDHRHEKDLKSSNYMSERVAKLEAENEQLRDTILELTAKVSRLEERILHTAKTRMKGH